MTAHDRSTPLLRARGAHADDCRRPDHLDGRTWYPAPSRGAGRIPVSLPVLAELPAIKRLRNRATPLESMATQADDPFMAGLVFGAVFLGMIAAGIALVAGSDRKRAVRHSQSDAVGVGGASAPVIAYVPENSALRLAQAAVRRVGARDVETLNGSVVVGWVGSLWTNLPKHSEYELGVAVSVLTDGSIQFQCTARPRFGSQLTGSARSNELATKLASEAAELAAG